MEDEKSVDIRHTHIGSRYWYCKAEEVELRMVQAVENHKWNSVLMNGLIMDAASKLAEVRVECCIHYGQSHPRLLRLPEFPEKIEDLTGGGMKKTKVCEMMVK